MIAHPGKSPLILKILKESIDMKPQNTVINHILDIIAHKPGCRIEHVADLLSDFFPDLTLKEVVYTLSYLSRKGQLDLIVDRQGGFAITPTSRLFN
jgi:hypothetical protein